MRRNSSNELVGSHPRQSTMSQTWNRGTTGLSVHFTRYCNVESRIMFVSLCIFWQRLLVYGKAFPFVLLQRERSYSVWNLFSFAEDVSKNKERSSIFQERAEPCPLSSSIHYGGQEEDMYMKSSKLGSQPDVSSIQNCFFLKININYQTRFDPLVL